MLSDQSAELHVMEKEKTSYLQIYVKNNKNSDRSSTDGEIKLLGSLL